MGTYGKNWRGIEEGRFPAHVVCTKYIHTHLELGMCVFEITTRPAFFHTHFYRLGSSSSKKSLHVYVKITGEKKKVFVKLENFNPGERVTARRFFNKQ